jgi:predicted NAD/FAD-dependent oxidoreductase
MWFLFGGSAPVSSARSLYQNRRVLVFAKAVEIGGQLAAQRFKSVDGKLGVLFVGLSAVNTVLIC